MIYFNGLQLITQMMFWYTKPKSLSPPGVNGGWAKHPDTSDVTFIVIFWQLMSYILLYLSNITNIQIEGV